MYVELNFTNWTSKKVVARSCDSRCSFCASAAEGEDMDDDQEDDLLEGPPKNSSPAMSQPSKPEQEKAATPVPSPVQTPPTTSANLVAAAPFITQHIPIQHKPPQSHIQPQPLATKTPPTAPNTAAFVPAHTQMVTMPSLHPTVIAHAPVSHPSVIQAVSHVIQGAGGKHGHAHLAPSPSPTAAAAASSVQLGPAHHQPISHITVAHLGQHLPALYPQPVAHIAHTLNHLHPHISRTAAATASQPTTALLGKQTAAAVVAHHPQLVGQTVFNPVTMVMPSFPISTLKLT